MQPRHVPATGPRYWVAISIASVFGANLGDFVSHNLHLGHIRGLPPLALVLTAILLLERRSQSGSQAYYWLAIVTLRTAATNLADLATHDLRLGYAKVVAVLLALLLAVLFVGWRGVGLPGLPRTDGRYWTAMLIAGTLGTALGDSVADDLGLGVGPASLILTLVLAAALGLHAPYWLTIVAVRTAGTTVGDLLAHSAGLAVSTACAGMLLAGTLALWPERRSLRTV